MTWYDRDPARLALEHDTLTALAESVSWLTVVDQCFDRAGHYCVLFVLRTPEGVRGATLVYPFAFPHSPPSVFPVPPEQWSGHQYGSGGELCLEYGPDNWEPDFGGVEMIQSTWRLLTGEAPTPANPNPVVPSRHRTTEGQKLRFEAYRVTMTQPFLARMDGLAPGDPVLVELLWTRRGDTHHLLPLRATDPTGAVWEDPSLSGVLAENETLWSATAIRAPAGVVLPAALPPSEVSDRLAGLGYVRQGSPEGLHFAIVAFDDGPRMWWLSNETGKALEVAVVAGQGGARLPPAYGGLAGKRVAIVGCGSAGGKIALMLARAGVGGFVLVDDDVLKPENLVRNVLDGSELGQHKAMALKRRILLVSAGCAVTAHRQRLGGQEASGSADAVTASIQGCDLVIDATAEPEAFNLLAGLCREAERPMLWLEIFGGGFGGLIARSRPGLDPSPQVARRRIEQWCAEQDAPPPPRPLRPYEADVEAEPLIADDADVTVMAAHAARFALDLLLEPRSSAYAQSAYVIGLAAEWIFIGPFDTRPLDLGGPEPASERVGSVAAGEALRERLRRRRDNADAADAA